MLKSLLALCALGAASALPSFPTEWNADTTQKVVIFQGGIHKPDGSACCSKTAPSCKVQAQAINGKQFSDATNNRTLLSTGPQALINLFHPINKQISAVPSASGKGWTCQAYCPLDDGAFPDPLGFGKHTKDIGTATVNGKTVEQYQWFDYLIIVKMDENDLYVDQSGATPVPVLSVQKITPFGGAELGESSNTFEGFTAGAADPSTFAIDNLSSCEESDQCNQNSASNAHRGAALLTSRTSRTLAELAEEYLQKHPMVATGGSTLEKKTAPTTGAAPSMTWPKDWSSQEESAMLINQGGIVSADGSQVCCPDSSSGQCQIQSQYLSGVRFYDASNNRTRFEDDQNGVTVDDHNVLKSMEVQHNGTHDVCVKYCPIDPRDTMDVGKNYFLDDNATDLGTAQFDGQSAEHYQWKDKILKIITMQTTDCYVSTTGGTATPLGQIVQITPFGQHLGTSGLNWTNFKIGSQPAEKFDIQGVDSCPMDQGCNQPLRQAYFHSSQLRHTFATNLRML